MDMPISRGAAYLKRNRTTHSWYGDWSGSNLMSASMPSARTLEEHIHRSRQFQTSNMSRSMHQRQDMSYHRGSAASDRVDGAVPVVRTAGIVTTGFSAPASSTASSPGPTTTNAMMIPGVEKNHRRRKTTHFDLELARPSSAYSYDGGFFVTANNHSKDCFVINPEWVSEDDTLKKLSGGDEVKQAMDHRRGAKDAMDGRSQGKVKPQVITWKSYAKRSKSAPPAKLRNPITWVDPVVVPDD